MDVINTKPCVMDVEEPDDSEESTAPIVEQQNGSVERNGSAERNGSVEQREPIVPPPLEASIVHFPVGSSSSSSPEDVSPPLPSEGTLSNLSNLEGDSYLSSDALQESEDKPTIPEVFCGKTILITGATGFIGKVLVEKLLRSCPGIKEILLLICGDAINDRTLKVTRLFKNTVFDRINEECPAVMDKLRSIDGDLTWENLGLEASILELVQNEVSFIFHCAANVRFDCNPRKTLTVNLLGVHYLLELCRTMKKLEAVVHVSTAYSFCNQPIIGEEVYPEKVRPDQLMDVLKWMAPSQLEHLCDYIVQGRPALYHVSKAMGETLIVDTKDLPLVIVRPSIVTAAMEEPYPGWVDNYNGPSGFIALSTKGILKTVMIKKDVTADLVPVDIVANTLISAAYVMALGRDAEVFVSGSPIINCVCPNDNSITWSEVVDICIPFLRKYPSEGVLREPGGVVTSSQTVHNICKVVCHYLPAVFMDFFIKFAWGRLGLLATYSKVHIVLGHLQLFSTHRFVFTSRNMRSLTRFMSHEDSVVFNIHQSGLNWPLYIEDYVHGVRKYFMKEKDETLPAARRRLAKLKLMYRCARIVPITVLLYFVCKRFNAANFIYTSMGYNS